jgi:hypothetical protein
MMLPPEFARDLSAARRTDFEDQARRWRRYRFARRHHPADVLGEERGR